MSILHKAAARQAVFIGIKWKASNSFSWDILKANWFWPILSFSLFSSLKRGFLRSLAPLILWCSLLQWNHANPSRTWLWNSEEVDKLVGSPAGKINLVPGWFFFIVLFFVSTRPFLWHTSNLPQPQPPPLPPSPKGLGLGLGMCMGLFDPSLHEVPRVRKRKWGRKFLCWEKSSLKHWRSGFLNEFMYFFFVFCAGEMAEWSKAADC